jgi:hypothetical protein
MSRTVQDIEEEIKQVKLSNPKWLSDTAILGYLTELEKRVNNLSSGNFSKCF